MECPCRRSGRGRYGRSELAELAAEVHCLQGDAREYVAEHRRELGSGLAERLGALGAEPSPAGLPEAAHLKSRLDEALRDADDALCRLPGA